MEYRRIGLLILWGKNCLAIGVLLLLSIELAAYGEDPDSFVRITSVNSKTGDLHVYWKNEIYRNCHRKMKGHTMPLSLTRVCIVGNGDFSGTSIQAVTSKDWFPVKEFLGNQVEEVRFNCDLDQIFNQKTGKITPVKSRMHFPLDTEASQGKRIQIELSCSLTKREVEQEMKKVAGVIRGLHHDPNAVIENAVSESQSECGKEIDSSTCKNLRTTVGKLVGGEFSQKMKALVSGIVTYRGTPLCGGYDTCGSQDLDSMPYQCRLLPSSVKPPAEVRECLDLDLRGVPEGSRCKTSKGTIFELVKRTEKGNEVWRDQDSGDLWGDRLDESMNYEKALTACNDVTDDAMGNLRSASWHLPTKEEYELDGEHGIYEVLPNMGHAFWSSTLFSGHEEDRAWNPIRSGYDREGYYSVRCVGR